MSNVQQSGPPALLWVVNEALRSGGLRRWLQGAKGAASGLGIAEGPLQGVAAGAEQLLEVMDSKRGLW
jgi:hypothetical protein